MAQSTTGGLVQTILGLRELEMREKAQALQAQMHSDTFGLQQQQFSELMKKQQMDATNNLMESLRLFGDPKKIKDPQLQAVMAQRHNIPLEQVAVIAEQLSPSLQALTEEKAARGAGGVSDQAVATRQLLGMGVGQAAGQEVQAGLLAGGMQGFDPAMQMLFRQGAMESVAGRPAADVARDQTYLKLPEEEKAQIQRIAGGLALGADSQAQLELGWAKYRQDERALLANAAEQQARISLMGSQAQAAGMPNMEEFNRVMAGRADFIAKFVQSRSTLTEDGVRTFAGTLNMYNSQLRNYIGEANAKALGIVDIPTDKPLSVKSLSQYFSQVK